MVHTDLKPRLYGIAMSARLLSVTESGLRNWVYQGRIRTVRLGSRIMIPATEIERILLYGIGPKPDRQNFVEAHM